MRGRLALLATLVSAVAACGPQASPSRPPGRMVSVPAEAPRSSVMELTITDDSERLSDARAATVEELGQAGGPAGPTRVAAAALQGGSGDILVRWTAFGCDESGRLTISPSANHASVAPDPIRNCDALGTVRGVVLSFEPAVAATDFAVDLLPTAVLEPSAATLDGRVTSVETPLESRLAVRICPEASSDCDYWLYPPANGTFRVDGLVPGRYTVAVFLETRNGLVHLTTSGTTLLAGRTTVVELVVAAIPSQPTT